MRRRLAIAAGLALALAGAVPSAWADGDEARVARDYLAAWNAHDADKAASYMAENVIYLDVTVGTPQKGREAARDNVIKVVHDRRPRPRLDDEGRVGRRR
jgi:ketosteroid isomerase-like protein